MHNDANIASYVIQLKTNWICWTDTLECVSSNNQTVQTLDSTVQSNVWAPIHFHSWPSTLQLTQNRGQVLINWGCLVTLRSRWITLREWMYFMAAHIWYINVATLSSSTSFLRFSILTHIQPVWYRSKHKWTRKWSEFISIKKLLIRVGFHEVIILVYKNLDLGKLSGRWLVDELVRVHLDNFSNEKWRNKFA